MQSILRLCYSKSPSNHQAPAVCLHGGMSSPQNLSSLQRYEFTVLYNRFLIQFLSLVSTAMLTRHTDNPIWQFCPSVCPSGCLSVRLCCSSIVSKRLNISSLSSAYDSPPNHSGFPGTIHLCEIPMGSPPIQEH